MRKRKKRDLLWFISILGICFSLSACGAKASETTFSESSAEQEGKSSDLDQHSDSFVQSKASEDKNEFLPLTENMQTITIPNLSDSYRLIIVNDLHIIAPDISADIIEEKRQEIDQRYDSFINSAGTSSSQQWNSLVDQINDYNPDAVLLVGDMVDFYCKENLDILQSGLDKINAPVIYTRADHDYATWYIEEEKSIVAQREDALCDNSEIIQQEFPDFIIVGINNSTSQMSASGLSKLKEIWQKGKPVLLVTHVLLDSLVDTGLNEASRENWGDRALLWGNDCYYKPDENTQEYLQMVLSDGSPVEAVISGHLHFPYVIQLNNHTTQYVFDATYRGNIGIVTISG